MSEDDCEPDQESEEKPPCDDKPKRQSDAAGSNMDSDVSQREKDWQAGSELPRAIRIQNPWLVEDHTIGNKDCQVRSKKNALHLDPASRSWIASSMFTKSDCSTGAHQEITLVYICRLILNDV